MNVSSGALSTATVPNPNLQNPVVTDPRSAGQTTKVGESEHTRHGEGHHEGRDGYHRDQNRALGVFGNEIRQRLSAMFRVIVSAQLQAYSANDNGTQSSAGLAAGVLGAAQKAVAQDPASSGQIVSAIKGQVADAASVANQAAGTDPSTPDVANTTDQINQGLDALAANSAQNVPSSASVLSIDSTSRQESTISIRTQEGDTVKITLRQSSELSAAAISASDANGSASASAITLANGTSLSMSFEGNINDQELAAIQDVFKQAATIANDFFGGDLTAAVQDAQGFQFDSSQLSGVSLGFRSEQTTTARYASVGPATGAQASAPAADTTAPALPAVTGGTAPTQPAATPATDTSASDVPASSDPVSQAGGVSDPAAPQPTAVDALPAVQADTSGLAQLFDRISSFLRSVSDGFAGTDGNASARFHFTQSFKLDILKAVVQTASPGTSNAPIQDLNAAIDAYPTSNDSNRDVAAQAA